MVGARKVTQYGGQGKSRRIKIGKKTGQKRIIADYNLRQALPKN
jgi:hypothetical protein